MASAYDSVCRAPKRLGRIRVRVRYCECDPMGVAHHGSYAAWLELGRTELLRTSGVSYRALEEAGVFLVVTRMEIRYRRPVRYDDEVEIVTRVEGGSRVKIAHAYEVRLALREGADPEALRQRGEDLLAEAETTLACVDVSGKPRALPAWLMAGDGGG